jgi:hypothetical protein
LQYGGASSAQAETDGTADPAGVWRNLVQVDGLKVPLTRDNANRWRKLAQVGHFGRSI